MKKEKAFTLIELLGVLVVLGLIVLIAFPNIVSLIEKTDDKEYERLKKDVELATEVYVNQNKDNFNLTDVNDFVFIELWELIEGGYFDKKTINPRTKEKIDLNSTVLVRVLENNINEYEYTGTVAGINKYTISNLKIMYDGYESINGSPIIWKNIEGDSYNGELENGATIDWDGNRIKLGNNDKHIKVLNSSTFNNNSITIEIAYEGYEPSSGDWQFSNSGLGLNGFNVYDDGSIKVFDNDPSIINIESSNLHEFDTVHTLTLTMEKSGSNYNLKVYGDGEFLELGTDVSLTIDNFLIGKYSEKSSSPVYIYAFRLYDGVLTEEQIAHNYQMDMNRYNWRSRNEENN